MLDRWPLYEVILFAGGCLLVFTSLAYYPWQRYRELLNEPPEHPAFFVTRANVFAGVALIAAAGVSISLRDGQYDAALISAGLMGLSTGALLTSWAYTRMIKRLLRGQSGMQVQ